MTSPLITIFILILTLSMYLIRDGKATMSCVLAPFCCHDTRERIMAELLPSWDANQTWLVFTLAGLYGGFPILFGDLLSQYYEFYGVFLISLIVRGAAIEFYIKSTVNKFAWLTVLAFASGVIIICHGMACYYLLSDEFLSHNKIFAVVSFIICFNFSAASSYLFSLRLWQRSGLILSLIVSSNLIFSAYNIDVSENMFNLFIIMLRGTLVVSFLIWTLFKKPPIWCGQGLLYILFLTNAFFVINAALPWLFTVSEIDNMSVSQEHFFVINIYSLIFLPIIAAMLWRVQKLFRAC